MLGPPMISTYDDWEYFAEHITVCQSNANISRACSVGTLDLGTGNKVYIDDTMIKET